MKQDSLFSSDSSPRSSSTTAPAAIYVANIDGGARGNPGPAAYGVVVRTPEGKIVVELAQYLGNQTNNFAEYSGLLAALEYAQQQKLSGLKIFSDSELLVKQMNGQYKVNHPVLRQLHEKAKTLSRQLKHFSIQHVLRRYNAEADALVNRVLDQREIERRQPR